MTLRTSVWTAAALLIMLAAGAEIASKPGPIGWRAVDQKGSVVGGRLQGVVTAAGSGVPLEGVRVTVTSTTASQRPVVAVTDSSGHYVVSQLPPSRYTVMFSKAGFVSVYHGQAHSVIADRSVPLVIDLLGGQHLGRISASLTRAGAIEGRIVDGRGEPVVDVTVSASRLDMAGAERRLVAVSRKAMSDDRGFYRLFGLEAGDYYISASIPRSAATRDDSADSAFKGESVVYFPGTANINDASRVSVNAAQDVSAIDITVRPTRLARISGIVIPSGGQLFPGGTSVALFRSGVVGGLAAVAEVRQDGRFDIAGVPPGEYVLQARSIPKSVVSEVARTGSSAALSQTREGRYGMLPVTVVDEDMAGVAIPISAAGVLKGGLVLDGTTYLPPSGARIVVTAIPAGAASMTAGPSAVRVQSDGTFDIGGLVGRFIVRITGLPGRLSVESVKAGGSEVTDAGVLVHSGQEISDAVVHLSAVPTRLVGFVRAGDTVVAEATVLAFSKDERLWLLPRSRYISAVKTDRAGAYAMDGLVPGQYFVVALPSLETGRERDPDFLGRLSARAASVTLRKQQPHNLNLQLNTARE